MNLLFLLKPKNTVDFLNGEDTVRAGLLKLRASGYTAAPVLSEEGKYIGTVTEGDFLWHLRDTPLDQETAVNHVYICEMMRENWNQPVHISATMEELLELVLNQNFVPVVDDRNYFVGIITRQSVIRHFVDRIQKLKHQVGEQELEKRKEKKSETSSRLYVIFMYRPRIDVCGKTGKSSGACYTRRCDGRSAPRERLHRKGISADCKRCKTDYGCV